MSRLAKLVRRASARYLEDVTIAARLGGGRADANDESSYAAGSEIRSIQKALVTYAAATQGMLRGWLEEMACDIVLDFYPEADLSGEKVRFIVNGEEFVQKAAGKDLSAFYTRAGSEAMFRTVLAQRTGRIEGRVRYSSAIERMDLYHYDVDEKRFAWANTPMLDGRARIASPGASNGNLLEISIQGALALAVNAEGALDAGEFIALSRPDSTALPRLEFYVGQNQVATATRTGIFYARRLIEAAEEPLIGGGLMTFKDAAHSGAWLMSLHDTGVYAPEFV